jgi:hypothetical protein
MHAFSLPDASVVLNTLTVNCQRAGMNESILHSCGSRSSRPVSSAWSGVDAVTADRSIAGSTTPSQGWAGVTPSGSGIDLPSSGLYGCHLLGRRPLAAALVD